MSEPVKIAEDLKDAYGHAVAARSGFVITLIERVSAAEAALALAKEELARLKAPVSIKEWKRVAFTIEGALVATRNDVNVLIAARSTAPDGAPGSGGDVNEPKRVSSGGCAAQVVDCNCQICGMGNEADLTPEVTAERAAEAVQRLINSHFRNDNRARCSIPANPREDDDLLASAYVKQSAARIAALTAKVAELEAQRSSK